MSIILKGIDMPKNGEMHRINIYDNGNTYITTSNILYETDRKDAEAIQIPKNHGRLIDADALFEAMGLDTVKEVMLRNWKFTTAWGVPIIEAEE